MLGVILWLFTRRRRSAQRSGRRVMMQDVTPTDPQAIPQLP